MESRTVGGHTRRRSEIPPSFWPLFPSARAKVVFSVLLLLLLLLRSVSDVQPTATERTRSLDQDGVEEEEEEVARSNYGTVEEEEEEGNDERESGGDAPHPLAYLSLNVYLLQPPSSPPKSSDRTSYLTFSSPSFFAAK